MTNDITLLETGLIYEADMLALALEEAGIPHYRRTQSFSGAQFAMPALPVQGPGVYFTVIVPEIAIEDARKILAELPIVLQPIELWGYTPRTWAKKYVWWSVAITLGILLISGVWQGVKWAWPLVAE